MHPRILIADDHSLLRRTLKAVLESHSDWQVCSEAVNGREAVQKAAESRPDIIILDVAMPVMERMNADRRFTLVEI